MSLHLVIALPPFFFILEYISQRTIRQDRLRKPFIVEKFVKLNLPKLWPRYRVLMGENCCFRECLSFIGSPEEHVTLRRVSTDPMGHVSA